MDEFKNRISGIEPFTMLDFPGNIATILFYNGCNIRCPYCYNAEVVNGTLPNITDEYIKKFLNNRKDKIDGIVFSGGECTIWGKSLHKDIKYVKDLGYKVKLDTNGTNPDLVKTLMEENLLDYVALDIKFPNDSKFYDLFNVNQFSTYPKMTQTLRLLLNGNVPFEVRTTVHPDITDEKDINNIISSLKNIGYKGKYFIQFYFDTPVTLKEINHKPRRFRTEELIDAGPDITIEYRNEMDNLSRHNE